MKEWRGNIVTVVQNPCCSARVPCKQTYSSPRGVAITLPLRRRSTRSLPCFNAEVPRGSQVNRQFESAAPLGYFEARQNPHSYLNYIHFLEASLSRENVTLSQTRRRGACSPHESRHAPRVNASSHEG